MRFPRINRPDENKLSTAPVDEETTPLIGNSTSDQDDTFQENKKLRQGLHARHMRMIGLAGGVGTGLFLNTGRALSAGGPLGTLIGYSVIGLAVCSIVMCVGELGALIPLSGAIVRWSGYIVDPALSFTIGWNLVYQCLVALPAELAAAAILVQFWSSFHTAFWIGLFGVIVLITALLFVRVFGEIEYITAILKIALVIGINIMALVIACIGSNGHEPTGFKYWHDPGPLVQYLGYPGPTGRFLGIWTCAKTAFYALSGLENHAVAAAEARDPRKTIPMAAKLIFFRVLFFFILTLFMFGLVIPSNDPNLLRSSGSVAQSPFVIAARRAGYTAMPSIINSVTLASAWSASNNAILHGSRYLYGLASNDHAPTIFTRLNRFGVPYIAIALHGIFAGLAFLSLSTSTNAVYGWLQSMVAVGAMVSWIVTCITYLRFYYACKVQGIDRKRDLPWAAPFQPYATWFTLTLLLTFLLAGSPTFVTGTFDAQDIFASYFSIPFCLVLYFSYKLRYKSRIIPLGEVPIRKFLNAE